MRLQYHIYNRYHEQLGVLRGDELNSAEYGLRVNDTGILHLVMSTNFQPSLFQFDGMIEILKEATPGAPLELELETAWFIRRRGYKVDENGIRAFHVFAYPAITLLDRRVAAYEEDETGSAYSGPADDGMKDTIRRNFGALATDATRDVSTYLSVAPDYSLCSSIDKTYPFELARDIIQGMADDHYAQHGVFVAYDIVRLPSSVPPWFEFRTYIGQRGIDRGLSSTTPLIFSEEMLNLGSPESDDNWEDERNVIYASGRGQSDEHITRTYINSLRCNLGPFSRTELLYSCQQAETTAAVKAEAYKAGMANRPRRAFVGTVLDSPGCTYGKHWNLGDRVVGSFDGVVANYRIDAVTVQVDQDGNRAMSAFLESETYYD